MHSLNDMSADEFIEFAEYALEKEQREEIKSEWIQLLPFMSLEMLSYMPFNEYYDRRTGKGIDMRPTEEIMEEIHALHSKGKGGKHGDI